MTESEDRNFARGNPFARALSPKPDDEKATSPGMYVVFGLLSLFVAALVLPPMFMYTLIVRGVRSHSVGSLVAGLAMFAMYFSIFYKVGKRLMSRPPAEG